MAKVLVLYYSSYGHIEQMAEAVAEGARGAGAQVDILRVPETAPEAVVKAAHFKTDSAHPVIAGPDVLKDYDAIIVGTPTRFGRMSSQMASFWDTAGGLWASGALHGKVGGAFTSSATQQPSIRYAGRLASDSLNDLGQGEATMTAGGGHQTHSSGRWGDYSMLTVDPADNLTFWHTNEYYAATSSASWFTRVGKFQFGNGAIALQ